MPEEDDLIRAAAVMRGWRVLRYTTLDLRKRPVQCVEEVGTLLASIAAPRAAQRGLFT